VKAFIFKNIGKPREVLRLEDIEEAKPGQAEVLLRMLFSPVNPSDMHMVRGRYGYQPSLPASPGEKSPMHSSTLLRAKCEFYGIVSCFRGWSDRRNAFWECPLYGSSWR
jgi:threonine dehydrogenase-like Zn-dependent dehydrogenase